MSVRVKLNHLLSISDLSERNQFFSSDSTKLSLPYCKKNLFTKFKCNDDLYRKIISFLLVNEYLKVEGIDQQIIERFVQDSSTICPKCINKVIFIIKQKIPESFQLNMPEETALLVYSCHGVISKTNLNAKATPANNISNLRKVLELARSRYQSEIDENIKAKFLTIINMSQIKLNNIQPSSFFRKVWIRIQKFYSSILAVIKKIIKLISDGNNCGVIITAFMISFLNLFGILGG